MVMNHVAIFSSFTYGKNTCTSTLLVEFITDWYKPYEKTHFYDVLLFSFSFHYAFIFTDVQMIVLCVEIFAVILSALCSISQRLLTSLALSKPTILLILYILT